MVVGTTYLLMKMLGKEKIKAVDNSTLKRKVQDRISLNDPQSKGVSAKGLNLSKLPESFATFNKAESENVLEGENNTYIVLGRDRPASKASGYGGQGATGAGAIDLVAGRLGYKASDAIIADPNFKDDAARIYISQKTDIDLNFGLTKGHVGQSKTRSGIGIKADSIRLIARQGIKLVTGTDEKNSLGGDIVEIRGIDLIAGNDDGNEVFLTPDRGQVTVKKLQPIPKGDNLVSYLKTLTKKVEDLNALVNNFLDAQMQFNGVMQAHTHITGVGPTTPSVEAAAGGIIATITQLANVKQALWTHRVSILGMKNNYLEPFGSEWICSRHNRVN